MGAESPHREPWPPFTSDRGETSASLAWPVTAFHLFLVDLASSEGALARLRHSLSPDEVARAARFRFPTHERRFVAGRGRLREILAAYLGCAPAEVRFEYGPRGMPVLQDERRLRFNLSHCEDLALTALHADRAVGVDLERVRAVPDDLLESGHVLSASERRDLVSAPAAARARIFFERWTRKEALAKSCGQGLAFPLAALTVPASLPEAAGPFTLDAPEAGERRWLVPVPTPAEGYTAALAVGDGPLPLLCRRWPCG